MGVEHSNSLSHNSQTYDMIPNTCEKQASTSLVYSLIDKDTYLYFSFIFIFVFDYYRIEK